MREFEEKYRFHSLSELISHFTDHLNQGSIDQIVIEAARHFIEKRGATHEDTRLQFLRKCERMLEAHLSVKTDIYKNKDLE